MARDELGWFGMSWDESRHGVAIRIRPGAAMDRSGSDLEWPWTDPDPDLDRMGPDWVGLDPLGSGLDRLGSDLDRLGSDLDRILVRTWAILDAN